MAQKHVKAEVQVKHYAMVADALMGAMTEVLGADVVTDEVAAAWSEAYTFLAQTLQKREATLYQNT